VLRLSLWAVACLVLGVLLVAFTDSAVVWSSRARFCGTFCHSMVH